MVLDEDTAASVTFCSTWSRVSFAIATEVVAAIAFALDYMPLKEGSDVFMAAGADKVFATRCGRCR